MATTQKSMKKIYIFTFITFYSLLSNAQTWTSLTSGTSNAILSVAVVSQDTCYVVGVSGTILKTINGGTTWTPQTSGTSNSLYSTAFVDKLKGFAVGDAGTVVKTTDGGATWSNLLITSGTLRFVYFFNSMQGFITGASGVMLKTIDGGTTWTIPSVGTSQNINAIYFTSASIGYATCSGGVILKSTDGGDTWSPLTSGTTNPLGIVRFTSATDGFIIGDLGLILKTIDSGTTWTPITSGTTTDNLTGMDFLSSSNGFIVGGNVSSGIGSRIETSNSGSSWTYTLPGVSRLTRVQFLNSSLGYAVGISGVILKYSSNVGMIEQTNNIASINIYPNPSNGSATIDLSNIKFEGDASFELFDIAGNLISKSEKISKDKIVLEQNKLSNGIYLIKFFDSKKIVGTGKIIFK